MNLKVHGRRMKGNCPGSASSSSPRGHQVGRSSLEVMTSLVTLALVPFSANASAASSRTSHPLVDENSNGRLLQGDNFSTSTGGSGGGAGLRQGANSCLSQSTKHTFNEFQHQEIYHIGVHSTHSFAASYAEYNLTFAEYLTETAGKRFDPPIRFDMIPYTFDGIFDAIDKEELDFMFTSPSIYSCIGIEVGASALGTIITHEEIRDKVWDLDVYSGVMMTHADNYDIETIDDLKGTIIGAGSISQLMGGQLQFYEMEQVGLSYVNDPKQVVFTGDQALVVRGVLSGEFDVGFVRTDQIERTTLSDTSDQLVNPEDFKVLSPKVHLMDNGDYFPFLHTTDVFPEWPFSMLTHIPEDVAYEVEIALRAIDEHALVGRRYYDCLQSSNRTKGICNQMNFPYDFVSDARCDTTKKIADLARRATKAGHFYGFRTPRSYFQLRSMQQDGGFLAQDENNEWHCTRPSNFYEGIRCPEGYFKRSLEEFELGCDNIGLPCKEGYDCFCSPCVRSHEVDVYEYIQGAEDKHLQNYFGNERLGCEKMEVCAHVEQTRVVTIRLFDNKHRINPRVRVIVHAGDEESKELMVRPNPNHTSAYEFDLSEQKVQAQVLEIFFNDEQIPESPIRIIVDELNCDAIYHANSHRSADENGNCVCSDDTYEIFGECISSPVFFTVIFSIVFSVMAVFVSFYLRYKKHLNDTVWHINADELHFNEPPEIIGQGGFGIVILGQYRGTKVAVKRVLPPKAQGSKRGSMMTGGSIAITAGDIGKLGKNDKAEPDNANKGVSFGDSSGSLVSGSSVDGDSDSDLETGRVGESSLSWERRFFAIKNSGNALRLLDSATQSQHDSTQRRRSVSESSMIFMMRLLPEGLRFDKHSKQKREFVTEMRLLSRLRHPCITTVMGAVISTKVDPMLVMEYMEFGSLYDLLSNDTMDCGGEILLQITRDIVQGLQFLHASKPPILHGDLKAKNILVDSRFRAKVADFGFSHIKQHKNKSVLRGTPFFMAPEYLRRQSDYTSQCDIYSFSMILYEMYARKEPFEGEDPRRLLPKICHPRNNKRPRIPEACPPKVEDIMKKCWCANPFFRPAAKDLDYILVEMSPRDAEPLNKNQNTFKDGMKRKPTSLYDVFPKHIADALNAGKKVEAESHEIVTVVFSDIIGFTKISQTFSALKVSNMLDRLYLAFDDLASKHKIFKVETIGDAYMGVTNLEGDQFDTHVKQIAEFAMDAVEAASQVLIDDDAPERGTVQIRVGFHSGPVVSNVIGSLNPRYGLFGDTVNTASRMESNSEAGRILCSHASAELLKTQSPGLAMKVRGKIKVKGKGHMMTYWVGKIHYRPSLVPILDVSEGDESEITMEHSNVMPSTKRPLDLSESVGTRETEEMISFADPMRSPIQINPADAPFQHKFLVKISDGLIDSLKELIASRPENVTVSPEEKEDMKRLENEIGGEATPFSELVDCIPFKQADECDHHHHRDPFDVTLDKAVVKQIREFVHASAGMYNSHEFHGVAHAVHVSSSAKAMLSRIVSDEMHDTDDEDNSTVMMDKSYGIKDDKLAQFAVMFGALIHDLDHRGIPNFCLANEDPELNIRYDGRAIAEQNSVDFGWELLMAPQFADLRACIYTSKEELTRFRQLVVNLVLVTDIFDPNLCRRRDDRWQRAFDPNHWSNAISPTSKDKSADGSLKANVILELLMQASDIGHTMQHWQVYRTWNRRLFEEMYAAYLAGRFPKDPSETWYNGELKFFDDKVIPLANELKACGIFGDSSEEYLQFAADNREQWKAEGMTIVQDMIAKVTANHQPPESARTSSSQSHLLRKLSGSISGKLTGGSNGRRDSPVNGGRKSLVQMGKSFVKTKLPLA